MAELTPAASRLWRPVLQEADPGLELPDPLTEEWLAFLFASRPDLARVAMLVDVTLRFSRTADFARRLFSTPDQAERDRLLRWVRCQAEAALLLAALAEQSPKGLPC